MKKQLLKFALLLFATVMGGGNALAEELTSKVVVNENFDDGTTTLFKGVERTTVANDNNVKFTTAGTSTRKYSSATYDFDTEGAAAVKINFSYYIANADCNYDVAFIIRDKDIAAGHAKQSMGLSGAFITIGRTRQSRVNYFSINREKTSLASTDNLGLWCNAEVYIDLVAKTINYKITKIDGGDVIKEANGISFKDANATNVNQIDFYACVDNENDYLDNLVITKYTASTPIYGYTVNAVAGDKTIKQLASGKSQQGLSYVISGLPYAIMNDGICYKLNDADVKNYQKTFTMGTADATETVSYTVADDIDYFFEAENILSKSYGNANGNYSGGTTAGVYTNANLNMSSIAAGVYTITVNTSIRRSNEDIFKIQTSTDNTDWTDVGTLTLTNNVGGNHSVDNICLPYNGSIRLVENKGQNMCHYVDYVTLKKTAEPITLNSSNVYSTYCPESDLDFSDVEGVEAYAAKVEDKKVITTKIEGKIKAGEGVLIKNVNGVESVNVPVTTGAEKLADNDLVGVTKDMTGADFEGKTAYVLVSDTEFQLVNSATHGTLTKGKAYLLVSNDASAKPASLVFGDNNATAISGVAEQTETKNAAIYNLQGMKVEKAVKGLYIINGKKYVK